jgi:hypothetical protein
MYTFQYSQRSQNFPFAEILLGTTPQSSNSTHHIIISRWIATMDFENSSQARSWLFDNVTLMQCRQKALTERPKGSSSLDRVRRFASGYHRRHADTAENFDPPHTNRRVSSESLTAEEQEMLVRFHAKQITQLIGPMAVLNGLVRNSTILATAIMLFRRFYVSNSVLDYEPRRVAVAAAYLASKVEEQRVEVRHIMVDGKICFFFHESTCMFIFMSGEKYTVLYKWVLYACIHDVHLEHIVKRLAKILGPFNLRES